MSEYIGEDTKAVLFDFDDTLVATIQAKWAQHKRVALEFYGITLTDEKIAKHWGEPFPVIVSNLYETDDAEQAIVNNWTCHDEYPKDIFPGTVPTLRHLRVAGKLMGIITATTIASLSHDLVRTAFPRVFIDYVQTCDDTPHHKPDPRVFKPTLAWLHGVHISPEEVTYVGDGLLDMKAATGAGFNFVGVETGLTTAEQFSEAGAVSVPGIADLIN